ncbi:hypothetical protein VTK26DRAFT_3189 [Humicola hyalothermophila]
MCPELFFCLYGVWHLSHFGRVASWSGPDRTRLLPCSPKSGALGASRSSEVTQKRVRSVFHVIADLGSGWVAGLHRFIPRARSSRRFSNCQIVRNHLVGSICYSSAEFPLLLCSWLRSSGLRSDPSKQPEPSTAPGRETDDVSRHRRSQRRCTPDGHQPHLTPASGI